MPRSPPCRLPPPAHSSDGDPGTPRNPPAISHLLSIPQGPRDTPKPPCRLPPPAHPSDGDPGTPQSPPAVSHLLPIPQTGTQGRPKAPLPSPTSCPSLRRGPRDAPKPPCRLPPPAHPSDGDPGTPQSPPAVSHLLPIPLLREQQGPGATPGVGQAGPQQ
uniref:Macaca fascicularis brain cDNA clone: QmoA-11056, similar to human myosin IC (MYO1C), mRNA, RefSeq: NM_033375.3 n=1 Tax=Macaca fascicularis TaxID=9541 RepID=I7GN35_MACFA|nr:unnamed protein product [Macaca fascicularis]